MSAKRSTQRPSRRPAPRLTWRLEALENAMRADHRTNELLVQTTRELADALEFEARDRRRTVWVVLFALAFVAIALLVRVQRLEARES